MPRELIMPASGYIPGIPGGAYAPGTLLRLEDDGTVTLLETPEATAPEVAPEPAVEPALEPAGVEVAPDVQTNPEPDPVIPAPEPVVEAAPEPVPAADGLPGGTP